MRRLNVAAAALNQVPLDWEGNRERIVRALEIARNAGTTMVCLPELCISGYGCEDAFQSPAVERTAREVLGEIVPQTDDLIVSVGLPMAFQGAIYNTTALCVDGTVAGVVAKQNLAGDGVHYEPRWFKPWPEDHRTTVDLLGRRVPFGDVYFDCGGIKVGFEICEDAWVADRPGGRMMRRGVDVIFNPSASHFAFDKHQIRERFVTEGSRAFGVSYLYANLLGNEAGRIIYDGGTLIASDGELKASGPRFSYADVEVLYGQVDVDKTRMNRAKLASFEPDPAEAERAAVTVDFEYPDPPPVDNELTEPDWMVGPHKKFEEFTRAVTLGLFDYLRKSHSRGYVVSLSGGADSSATAILSALAIRFAARELGPLGLAEKLGHIDGLDEAEDVDDLVGRLVTTAYQATRNSSETTRDAAETVAETIGATYHELDVDALVEGYTDTVEEAIGRDLTWQDDDITLQNIQARARAPSIWMFANLENKLLLATSNRSEAAVGYTTMDGDTCGGLSPIAGIDKAFLRRWLVWMRDEGPSGGEPMPELEVVTDQQPTAELRPREADQTDEGDLMPYELLDAIERAAIRDKQSPLEVFETMQADFDQFTDRQLADWIEQFFRLWSQNQWKRERYAPSFHLDDENLDPKTWCRFPILSGGFERELRQLRNHLNR